MAKRVANSSGSHCQGRRSKRLRTLSFMKELKSGFLPPYFERKFERDILHALHVIETDVLLRKPVHWNMLLRVVRAMEINSVTAPYCLKFLQELLSLFERYQCKDVSVIAEVFALMVFLTEVNPEFILKPPETLTNSVLEDYNFSVPYSRITNFFYMPYGVEDNILDLVWNTARRGNVDLLKLQMKFGMGMMIPGSTLKSFCDGYTDSIPRLLRLHNSAINETDLEIIQKEKKSILQKLTKDFDEESRKRLCLVFRVLEIVCAVQFYPEYKDHFIECYRLLFDSIPEAYVTSVEVQTSLEKCLPDACSGLISEITKDFKRHLPELAEVPQPRSLQHLCRIQARQSLRLNLNLPHGVSSLPLPTQLKKYITLNDDNDYSIILRYEYDREFLPVKNNRLYPYVCRHFSGLKVPPVSLTTIPVEDDCMISFLRNL